MEEVYLGKSKLLWYHRTQNPLTIRGLWETFSRNKPVAMITRTHEAVEAYEDDIKVDTLWEEPG